jgi:MFS family permease
MWRLGFFFHEMGFGLLSIFLPLYVIALPEGTLVAVGIMTGVALFLAIPASFFWGYICDKTRRYKRYILLSFITSTTILYLFTFTTSVTLLILLYALMSILHIAHEPPKNVLIAELYSREEWERSFAFYEGLTEVGWLIGLILGFLASVYGFGPVNTLLLCSALNLVAFALTLGLVTDPALVFERGLVNIEKSIDFSYRGIVLASKLLDGQQVNERLKKENLGAFCTGLVLFSLATSILFTPMPIFVARVIQNASLPASLVFAVFVLNSGGAVMGYYLAGRRSNEQKNAIGIGSAVIFRSILSFSLIAVLQSLTYSVALMTTILILMGFANAVFFVYTLSLSMELIPSGKAGLFNVFIGIGGACGSFIGPFIAQAFQSTLGFTPVFLAAGIAFLMAYLFFRFLM